MRNILVLGAGRSSSSLISYLLEHAQKYDWQVTVGDVSEEAAREKTGNHPRSHAIKFDIHDASSVSVGSADVVISLLPPHLHPLVARQCLEQRRHLLHASYNTEEMRSLHQEALGRDLLFLNECGLDPGIDHMSAMQLIDRIRQSGGKLISFESFTGGLIAPQTDPGNPWRYKFTWNPRNVVMAGQGTAKFLEAGKFKYTPYQRLFKRTTSIHVPGHGDYEGYANRDSLVYIETYGLEGIQTMLRGTLRNKGFCLAWNIFVQLGCCDDTYEMEGVDTMTHSSFIDSFLAAKKGASVVEKLCEQFAISPDAAEINCLQWSGFFNDTPVGLNRGTPAQILEHILNKKWKLQQGDKDQIVMWHRFVYVQHAVEKQIQSSLVVSGTDPVNTAMARTVGIPLAIAAKLILQGKITSRGVAIPNTPEFYGPILAELKTLGIVFQEMAL